MHAAVNLPSHNQSSQVLLRFVKASPETSAQKHGKNERDQQSQRQISRREAKAAWIICGRLPLDSGKEFGVSVELLDPVPPLDAPLHVSLLRQKAQVVRIQVQGHHGALHPGGPRLRRIQEEAEVALRRGGGRAAP